MRIDESKAVRVAIKYKPSEKRLKGTPRKRWFDRISQILSTLDVEDWKEFIQDRERCWKAVTVWRQILQFIL